MRWVGVPSCPHPRPPCSPPSPPSFVLACGHVKHNVVINMVACMVLVISRWRQTLGVVVLAGDNVDGIVSTGMRQLHHCEWKGQGLLLALVVSGQCDGVGYFIGAGVWVWVQVRVQAVLHLLVLRGSQGCADDNDYVIVYGGSCCCCPAHSHCQMVDVVQWAYCRCTLPLSIPPLISPHFCLFSPPCSLTGTGRWPLGCCLWLHKVSQVGGGG